MPVRPIKFTLPWGAVLLLGLAMLAGWWRAEDERRRQIERLMIVAETGTVAMPAEAIASLTGSEADEARAAYAVLKERLQALRTAYPAVRFAYVFRYVPDRREVVFLADSEEPDSEEISLPGDVYEELADSPGLLRILADGEPAFEGPLSDEFGTWVTAYARIDGTGAQDVLGLDIAARDWQRDLIGAGLEGAGLALLAGGGPWLAWWWRRRRAAWAAEIDLALRALEQSQSAIMIVGLNRRITYANAGLCRQLGYSAEELVGRDWREFKTGETSEEMLQEMVRKVRNGEPWEGDWTNRRRDGSSYPVRGHITPVRRHGGELRGFIAVFDDMTDINRREQELRAARDQAQAGERAKSQFLATMSHEVRTPLNGIVGYVQLLEETPLNPDQRECLATVRRSAESLVQLASQILDHSRMEAGSLALELHATDPQEILEEALELFAARVAAKGLWLTHRVASDVPRMVLTDAGRLRQVLLNLIGNAVKFTATGGVSISLTAQADGEQALLTFVVTDTGPGISPTDRERLFKPFAQLEEGARRRHGGTGLGLVISRELARALGGDVTIGRQERGARFEVTMRAAVAEAPRPLLLTNRRIGLVVADGEPRAYLRDLVASWQARPVEVTPESVTAAGCDLVVMWLSADVIEQVQAAALPETRWPRDRAFGLVSVNLPAETRRLLAPRFRVLVNLPLRHREMGELLDFSLQQAVEPGRRENAGDLRLGLRILIVDDNPVNRSLMQRLLDRLGCTWATAQEGREAIKVLQQDARFDVILMDLHMPQMDGMEAVRRIRAGEAGNAVAGTWVCAVTADHEPAQRERAEQVGCDDFATKPLGRPEVQALLLRFLEARRRAATEA